MVEKEMRPLNIQSRPGHSVVGLTVANDGELGVSDAVGTDLDEQPRIRGESRGEVEAGRRTPRISNATPPLIRKPRSAELEDGFRCGVND